VQANSARDLRKVLSEIMHQVYPRTPKINNEMIVRHKPSSQIINARKKLLLGILERSGQENLGIAGNFPDASMFRTVLLHTGLYTRDDHNGQWTYALPDNVPDPGLRTVWQELQGFLTDPAVTPKPLRPLFEKLMGPPFGVRAGLLPIFFAAALKAFPSALSLTKGGVYITDILPSEIEQLCREPELYRLAVVDLTEAQRIYLHGLHRLLSAESHGTMPGNDLIRGCFDALERWKAHLPPAALVTRQVSERTRRFQAVLRQPLDPVHLLLEAIPAACDASVEHCEQLLHAIGVCMEELMSMTAKYRKQAATSVRRLLASGRDGTDCGVRDIAHQWASCFPEPFMASLTDGIAKGLLARMRTPYDTDATLIESLSSLLVGKSLGRWDDSTITLFDRELYTVVRRIEEAALASATSLQGQGPAIHGLAELIQRRIGELFEYLVHLVGATEAQETLSTVGTSAVRTLSRKDGDGNDHGSPSAAQ
jgi:hypothetical protein